MIAVTGAGGFIGSAVVWRLNREGIDDILVVDTRAAGELSPNLTRLRYARSMDRGEFLAAVRENRLDLPLEAVVHMGACSSTAEQNEEFLRANNTDYSRALAEWCVPRGVRFLYASSAATYGDGSLGFSDDPGTTRRLRPLNPYGRSKQAFDLWVLEQGFDQRVAGFKFFNVFGPNEYHKGPMVSGAYRSFLQARDRGVVTLFRSDHPGFADGEQRRDFVYVRDCVDLVWWFLNRPDANGIYNVGAGVARTWRDLARAVFAGLERPESVEFVPMPEGLHAGYQYHTQADPTRLRAVGYHAPFTPLEDAVEEYVRAYLLAPDPYLRA